MSTANTSRPSAAREAARGQGVTQPVGVQPPASQTGIQPTVTATMFTGQG